MATTTPTFNRGRAWLITIIIIYSFMAFGMSAYKQMSVIPLMLEYFNIDIGVYGTIAGAVGLFCIVGSIPSGVILAKLGPRRLLILSYIIGIAGMVLQIFLGYAGVSFALFYWVGVIGVLVYGCFSVASPMLITAWFPPAKRGLPNAIGTVWISLAMLLVLVSTNGLLELTPNSATAFLNVWWLIVILMAIALLLIALFVKMPPAEHYFIETRVEEASPKGGKQKSGIVQGIKKPGVWMLVLIFLVVGFLSAAFGNYFPTYLSDSVDVGGGGLDLAYANTLTSITTYVMLVVCVVYGFVLNKIPTKQRAVWLLIFEILIIITGFWMFNCSGTEVAFLLVYGVTSQLVGPVLYCVMPEICDNADELSGGIGVVNIIAMISGSLATALTAGVRAFFGTWQSVNIITGVFGAIGLVCAIAFVFYYKKKVMQRYDAASPGAGA